MGLRQDLVFRIARRWIAGKDMGGALDAAKGANRRGFIALLNFLGEDVTDGAVAESQTNEYLALQKAIAEAGIDGSVSVKLTQLGLLVNEQLVAERLVRLASNAASLGQLLWIDMEGSAFTDKTLKMYTDLFLVHKNAGLALQAYMKRSEADLIALLDIGATVRLVKGAYREDHDTVFGSRREVSANYSKLMRLLFERGEGFTIATHDSALVEEARVLAESRHKKFEFGMLRGIRDELKAELVASGYKVVDYIPYGDQWYAYSIRRIKEHPSNVWLLLRSLF
ncbi:MAG: proline dehydrogenase family protein [Thaumarchaeota archaeon]|nr:proline dehydrogenase family protein [Nitrososphaerota archaeon]